MAAMNASTAESVPQSAAWPNVSCCPRPPLFSCRLRVRPCLARTTML